MENNANTNNSQPNVTLNGQAVTGSQLQEAKDKVEGTNQVIRETKPGEYHTLTRMQG